MENIKKRPNAYDKLFSFFKSETVQKAVSVAILFCSLTAMLAIDRENYIREKYLPFLDGRRITDFLVFSKFRGFNIDLFTWIIFISCFTVSAVLIIGSIFSKPVTDALASNYLNVKIARTVFGTAYYILLVIVSVALVFLFCALGDFGNIVPNDVLDASLNLVYSFLIACGTICAVLVTILIVYTLLLVIFAILGFAVYEIVRFAKALDTDSSVFGTKSIQVITVSSANSEEKAEAVEEAIAETEDEVETIEEAVTETEDEVETVEEAVTETEDEVETVEEAVTETEDEVETVEEATEESGTEAMAATEEFKFSGDSPRLKTSFLCRLIQADRETADCYSEIKNRLLSYKGVNSRISRHCDTFNNGRNQCAKLNIRGKTVILYIALDPNEYSVSKYHHTDVSDKSRYARTPMMLRVRSKRSLKYALELISLRMQKNGVKQKKEIKNVDYSLPYESSEALLERGLIKRV